VSPIDALRAIHEELWDPERGMDRFAPGVVPDVDIGSLNLHAVRETALGAYLDLVDGHTTRALTAIGNVLALQYPTSDRPWSGTFPVTAEQPEPPAVGAVEWIHYDPNWRQFLGCILALTTIDHGSALPDEMRHGVDAALRRCVDGEPDDRIAPWYTNPNLMHAWLLGHVGRATSDTELSAAGERRRSLIVERFERFGDIDEYNSPTYDGIDLFALALWAAQPPTPSYERSALAMIERIGERIARLHHPRFGSTCGPFIRAYGLQPERYVSLAGVCTFLAGAPAQSVLPTTLGPSTVHVHDLYFLPVLARLAPAFADRIDLRPVTAERRHEQRFTGSVAESLLRHDLAVGWESGRRHDASLDQYVPFSAHFEIDDERSAVGVMVPDETAWVDAHRIGDLEFELTAAGRDDRVGLRIVVGAAATVSRNGVTAGRCHLAYAAPADHHVETATAIGSEIHVQWQATKIDVRVTLDPR
jgi:hypothetical protein